MTTPDEQKNNSDPVKKITLPSGKKAQCIPSKGKHIREAQKQSGEDPDKLLFALIAVCTTIDGKKIVMEDVDEMSSADVFQLMGEFGSAF